MTRRNFTPEALAFAAILLSPASCQIPAQSGEIKSLLEKRLQDQDLAGIAAIVIRSHTVIGMGTAGVKRRGKSTPLEAADMFHIGSNTKAITAAMIARLVEAGTVSWTATPEELIPELKDSLHPAYQRITMEELLSHHAGIPSFTEVQATPRDTWPKPWPRLSGSAMEQRSQFTALVLQQAPAITPGTKGLYSNAGYVIAAAMAERRTGVSWEDLVTSQVLEPLGMRAVFGFPLLADVNQPWGHVKTKRGFKPVPGSAIQLPPYMLPAGGMSLSLADYARFLQMNLKGLRDEDATFLAAKTIQRLHSSTMHDQYALGWEVTQIDGVPASVHNGSAGSFYALVALQPSRDEGVAIVLNSSGERSWETADALLTVLLRRYAVAAQ